MATTVRLGYSREVSDRRPLHSLILLGLLWLASVSPAFSSPLPDDMCGRAGPPVVRCPRTQAAVCVCYLHARTNPGEFPPACPREVVRATVRRPAPPLLRQLPQLEPMEMCDRFYPAVPTRPPEDRLLPTQAILTT